MKKLSLTAFVVLIFVSITSFAQGTMEVLKSKTKSNQSNDRSINEPDESLTVKIRSIGSGVELTFNQAIVSPRDAASGLPTGKRQHKPFVITKEYDKSSPVLARSGGGSGKVSVQDISVVVISKGRTQKLPVINGTFILPTDGKDDDCDLVASWSWGETQSGQTPIKGSITVGLTIQNGACVAIKQKGTGADKD